MTVVNGLWIGDRLSALERACVWNNLLTQTPLGKDVLRPEGSLLRNFYEWTIGTDGFRQELILLPSSPPNGLSFSIVNRQ